MIASRRVGLLISAALVSSTVFAGGVEDTPSTVASSVAGATAPLTEGAGKAFMQIVERHSGKDSNFANHKSCREVFTGNGKSGREGASLQYMAVMGMGFLRQACRCPESQIRQHLIKAPEGASTVDVLTQRRFQLNGQPPSNEKDVLVNEFALLYTLGQRESSGDFNEGRDGTMWRVFTKKRQWEAGAFQASADSLALGKGSGGDAPLTKQVMANYLQSLSALPSATDRRLACDLPILAGARGTTIDTSGERLDDLFASRGVCAKALRGISSGSTVYPSRLDSHDSTVISCFRDLNQRCPAFSIEYAAVTTRVNRMHWGPLRKYPSETTFKRPYPIPACADFFAELYARKNDFCDSAGSQELPAHRPDLAVTPPAVDTPAAVDNLAANGPKLEVGGGIAGGAAVAVAPSPAEPIGPTTPNNGPFNAEVVAARKKFVHKGVYTTEGSGPMDSLIAAVKQKDGKLEVKTDEKTITSSHCATATYAAFIKSIEDLQKAGKVTLTKEQAEALVPKIALDGDTVWGRWNANGPGVAMLFKELGLGKNFIDPKMGDGVTGAVTDEPKEGDFIKIFWRWGGDGDKAVGATESGHMAIFSNYIRDNQGRITEVCYWTSNQGKGMSEKCMPKADITHAIFSRLEHPENLAKAKDLPRTNLYLAKIGNRKDGGKSTSFREALRQVGVVQ